MESLFILIPITLLLVGVAIAVFFWAVRSGQFDDLDSPAWRILGDDDDQPRR
ncbi:cbb3-type cytochrome oxidase assembly protein CcoS [Immundisolibacter sp.]|uniref:cbb3-type cytochrome oxidase assembly protein CcoS n=1 Tax=Immundisolibacter sp. TaxID=1934948 RepID=UPI00261DAB82|nr:cbb3-type cytochrome oxidase assembly protein CcoS [Immundisolibacter sp.]MDD3651980.1 cbb3-type cytochrome oxidase assembly protein CcoS [Immundisolibacter sp.]